MSENNPQNKTATRLTLLGVLVVGVAAAFIVVYSLVNNASRQANSTPAVIEDQAVTGVIDVLPARQLQAFTLNNQDNEPTSLSDFEGRFTLILFGYTHCPDVCPLTLLEYKKIKKALGENAAQVNFVFISVDGERDTPAVMKDYVARFDEGIIGLSGDEATLTRVGTDYDLYFAKRADPTGSSENYLVDHTSNTFLADQQGQLVAMYLFQTEASLIAEDIQKRLAS